ncbi:predicted protein [Sclerotinia sclerotiorum 1980 UF-70]|uniref:Uncharacterized protein n=2 Tax=Sclerotinia sclerotiorum (strain ATCC 18683 / 1980 / Ss-1) TaxID=665079 RepID=A7F616_SCLS1|nr:predicted protein [Sclerotinia sclerotiorum 1980 UF-70]APA07379.1 hypothetical protein sscle_02g021490 [Sclerotinia sclerotiorum 1980 UF-70]EDN98187.1 predicted protein [Sclerotinia sclerotiorum 1980 UF-70]
MCKDFIVEKYDCSDWHVKVKNELRKIQLIFQKCEAAQRREAMEFQRLGDDARHIQGLGICNGIKIPIPDPIPITLPRACPDCEKKALEAAKRSREADLERIRTESQPQELPAAPGPAPKEGTDEVAGARMTEKFVIWDIGGGGREAWIKDDSDNEPKIKEESPDTSRPAGPSGSGKRHRSRK